MSEPEESSLTGPEPKYNVDRVSMIKLDLMPAILAEGIPITKAVQRETLGLKEEIPGLKFDYLNLNPSALIYPAIDFKPPFRKAAKFLGVKDSLTYMTREKWKSVSQYAVLNAEYINRLFNKRDEKLKIEFAETVKSAPDRPFLVIYGHGDENMSDADTKNWRVSGISIDTFEEVNLGTVFDELDIDKYSAVLLISCNPNRINLADNPEGSIPVYYKTGIIPSKHPVERVFVKPDGSNIADPGVRITRK